MDGVVAVVCGGGDPPEQQQQALVPQVGQSRFELDQCVEVCLRTSTPRHAGLEEKTEHAYTHTHTHT